MTEESVFLMNVFGRVCRVNDTLSFVFGPGGNVAAVLQPKGLCSVSGMV